jgi:hypothetical protein
MKSCLCLVFLLVPAHSFTPRSLFHRKASLSSLAVTSGAQQLVDDSTSGTWGSATVVGGEADLALRQGLLLEKSGQARAASAAFLEAATLYQCRLNNDEFGHVTSLQQEEVVSVLAYVCVRLAHISHDALGDSKAATRLYQQAVDIDPQPSAVSHDGMGTCIEASGGDLKDAVVAYREANRMTPGNTKVIFHMAVALERLGELEEAESLWEVLRRGEARRSCLVDSWGYVRWHVRKVPPQELNLYRGTRDMLQIALDAAMPLILEGGLVCEFGVASGRSIRMTEELLPLSTPIHGFDTFTGLPHAWGNEPKGSYSTGGVMPTLEGEVYFHKGLFADTIPEFIATVPKDTFLAYGNIDCDLYSSTLDILEAMHGRIVPGTILVFDEYLCHPTWRQDEFRAWRECCKRFGWQYEYLAFSLATKQTVVRVSYA